MVVAKPWQLQVWRARAKIVGSRGPPAGLEILASKSNFAAKGSGVWLIEQVLHSLETLWH